MQKFLGYGPVAVIENAYLFAFDDRRGTRIAIHKMAKDWVLVFNIPPVPTLRTSCTGRQRSVMDAVINNSEIVLDKHRKEWICRNEADIRFALRSVVELLGRPVQPLSYSSRDDLANDNLLPHTTASFVDAVPVGDTSLSRLIRGDGRIGAHIYGG